MEVFFDLLFPLKFERYKSPTSPAHLRPAPTIQVQNNERVEEQVIERAQTTKISFIFPAIAKFSKVESLKRFSY